MNSTTTSTGEDSTYRMGLGTGIGIGAGFLLLVCFVSFACVKLHSDAHAQQRQLRQQQQDQATIAMNPPSLEEIIQVSTQPRRETPGLDELTLQSYPKMVYSDGNKKEGGGDAAAEEAEAGVDSSSCSICLAEYEDGQTLRQLPACRHSFHMPCIDTWLRLRVSCPVCRLSPLPMPAFTPLSGAPPRSPSDSSSSHHLHR